MALYRLYVFGEDDRLPAPIEMECEDDLAAIARSARLRNENGMELWTLSRIVKIFPTPGHRQNELSEAPLSEKARLFREHWIEKPIGLDGAE